MILVDTSVWIRFLGGKQPFASELDQLLESDAVLGHDLVYGELLIGDRGGRPRLLSLYSEMRRAIAVPHAEVVEFAKRRKLSGRGLGWIDTHLLASALVERAPLYTADATLADAASRLGIVHQPGRA